MLMISYRRKDANMDKIWELNKYQQELACIVDILLSEEPDEGIPKLLSCLGEHFDSRRTFIFEEVRQGRLCNTYEWCAPGVEPEKEKLQYAAWELVERLFPGFKQKKQCIVIEDLENIREVYPQAYEWLNKLGQETLIIGPLEYQGEVRGLFGVANLPKFRVKTMEPMLPLLGQAIVTMIRRRDRLRQLQYMSFHDQLTGVYNRYAMDAFLSDKNEPGPLGLIYCDISGLKSVNDERGHIHGDSVILRVSELLTELFCEEKVYRIGGDEFVVMCFGEKEASFMESAEQLRQRIPELGTHVAMGASWSAVGSVSVTDMVLQAEDAMYKDKRSYYQNRKLDAERQCGNADTKQQCKNADTKRKCEGASLRTSGPECAPETPFQMFVRHNYFDAEAMFMSVAIPEAPYYLYFGDLQQNLYYISDNMRDDFGFQSNVVLDLIDKWGTFIHDPQERALYQEDLRQMLDHKKDVHSLRYRVTDKSGYTTWVHCRGIIKWSDDKTTPLFFSGCVSRMESSLSIDEVTGFLREQGALNELSVLESGKNPAIVIGFGLNNFTYINESRGRLAGDTILRNIANALLDEMGTQYTFYRLDGIRFMAISRPENTYAAGESVDHIRRIIDRQYSKHRVATKQAAAFGVLGFPEDGLLPQEILENAITLINVAKLNPELEYSRYSPDIITKQKGKSNMALNLNESVEKGCENFRMVVQPIVDCVSGRIIGGETLLRWKYQGQDISPAVFIPLLEETRMILTVGKWVFEQAVEICGEIIKYQKDFLLSFNVSYLQVLDDTFLPFMRETLNATGLDGRHLMLELTETHFDEMPERLHHFVRECLDMGMEFALDDFGNAFSSLQLLLRYPVNVIKLDRTLMNEITHSNENLDFIMSIVYACHRSGKKVCVEGVENDDELSAVRQTDCDMIQGFYFYRPMEISALYDNLKNL